MSASKGGPDGLSGGVDAHQHFWVFQEEAYPWILPGQDRLRRDFLPPDLAKELEAANLEMSVAVQARQSLEETEWLLDLADQHPRIAGVVGWVDLRGPALEKDLERLAERPRLRGFRHVLQDEPDGRFMLRQDFLKGLGLLRRYGFTYDILVFSHHLAAVEELVSLLPDQPLVLDHLGKPRIRDGEIEPWRGQIRRLARHQNLWCKVSGFVTEAAPGAWKPETFRPYLETVLEAFGPTRLMFGSDWPVCLLEAGYGEVRGLITEAVGRLSPTEEAALYGKTARTFYSLESKAE